jgi:selenocysteine lyase/cysteine desulfurase
LAHKSLSSFPEGTVRFGFGVFNTFEEVDEAVEALQEISIK